MNLFYLIFLFNSCVAFELPRSNCDSGLKINDDQFNVSDTYHVGDVFPTDAHYDVYGNLFYVESGRNADQEFFFNINIIKNQSTQAQKIQGLPEGLSYSIAVDKKNTKVYFGTGMGIYAYNYEANNATLITKEDFKLDMIFVDKDSNKYITEHNNGIEELYRLDGDKKVRVNSLQTLNEMAIDDYNNFYYILNEKLCVMKAAQFESGCFGNVSYDGIAQISIHRDRVFVASNNLTYFQVTEMENYKTVDNVPGRVTAIAFDFSGNFILGVPNRIVKYTKSYFHCNENE